MVWRSEKGEVHQHGKKMVDYRNHRRFTLRCIKAGITPVNCSIRKPFKTLKGYQIIHKDEKNFFMKESGT